jgi:hypothetical protein
MAERDTLRILRALARLEARDVLPQARKRAHACAGHASPLL